VGGTARLSSGIRKSCVVRAKVAGVASPGTFLSQMVLFVRLGRPLFLGGGFLLYGLGAAIAALNSPDGVIDGRLYLLGQAAVTAFQLMTHYANDYFDFEADKANLTPTRWSGGSRVLVGGGLPQVTALIAALVLLGLGLTVTAVLGGQAAGPLVVPALLATAALAWAYSAPPLRLHSSGFGEVNVAIVVTGLVPFLGFHLQAPDLRGLPVLVLASLPLMLLQVGMLLAIEFPDAEGDRAAGKRTLLVRLGVERTARLYLGLLAAIYLLLPLLVLAGLPGRVALAAGLLAPLSLWRMGRLRAGDHRDPARWAALTFWAVALLVLTAAAELVAVISLRPPLLR
jgi:1,4-dihydroxy-2-naphthoate polyprenyltransferase